MRIVFLLLLLIMLPAGCNEIVERIPKLSPEPAAPALDELPQPQDPALQVLFIGNSFTYYNNLPLLFAGLAQSGGHAVDAAMATRSGWTLGRHAHDERTLETINERAWDFVILQEYSSLPALASLRAELMYPAARILHERIRENGAETIFFMTWGYRYGITHDGLYTFHRMQHAISEGYSEIAGELNAIVSPVGLAWLRAITLKPELPLWANNGSHPALHGSYLAACVFYALIYRESPLGSRYYAGLPEEDARFLQSVAAQIVLSE